MNIIIAEDYYDMSRKAANIVSAQIILFPRSVLGLATGVTPIGMYQKLIEWHHKGDIDFSMVQTVNLDEYIGLSKEDKRSYNYFMQQNFFNSININPKNVMIPNGLADDIMAECRQYDCRINEIGGIDLQVLGLGHNGHIGFNEPSLIFKRDTHKVKLSESTINANARFFDNKDEMPKSAISMGMGTIMKSRKILLLCSGKEKSSILNQSLFGDINPMVPASILQLHPNVTVAADRNALSQINFKKDRNLNV